MNRTVLIPLACVCAVGVTIPTFAQESNNNDTKTMQMGSSQESQQKTVADIIASSPDHKTLSKYLEKTGLRGSLQNDGTYTVFAPTDEAFEKLDKETVKRLKDDKKQLARVLKYHVVTKSVEPNALTKTRNSEEQTRLSTLSGRRLAVNKLVQENGQSYQRIEGSNGSVYVIDKVLMPQDRAIRMANENRQSSGENIGEMAAGGTAVNLTEDQRERLRDTEEYRREQREENREEARERKEDNRELRREAREERRENLEDAREDQREDIEDRREDNMEDAQEWREEKREDVRERKEDNRELRREAREERIEELEDAREEQREEAADRREEYREEKQEWREDAYSTDQNRRNDRQMTVDPSNGQPVNQPQPNNLGVENTENNERETRKMKGDKQQKNTVADIIKTNKQLSEFAALVQQAELTDELMEDGPITVFAPSNKAIKALQKDSIENLKANPDELEDLLLNHIYEGKMMAQDIKKGQSIKTMVGDPVMVSDFNNTLRIGGGDLVKTDIKASNGVIHIIDALLPVTYDVDDENETTNQ